MKPRHQISRSAIALIKRFEGFRSKAAPLSDGRWTIGHGHTQTAREGGRVSEADAEALLIYDLISVAHLVNEHVFAPLTQNQFDALCSFAFNVGAASFCESAVLLRLNEGRHLQAACAMDLWRKAELAGELIVVDALVRRRSAEKTLFLTPPGAWPLAPTPVLRPLLDVDSLGAVPIETPVEVSALLDGDAAATDGDPSKIHPAQTQTQPQATMAAESFVVAAQDAADEPTTASAFSRHEAAADRLDSRPASAVDRPGAADWPAESVVESTAPATTIHRRQADLSTIWGLAAAGLGLVLLGLIGAFSPRTADGDPSGLTILGWLAGLTGVGLFSLSAYRLLRRLDPAAPGEIGSFKR